MSNDIYSDVITKLDDIAGKQRAIGEMISDLRGRIHVYRYLHLPLDDRDFKVVRAPSNVRPQANTDPKFIVYERQTNTHVITITRGEFRNIVCTGAQISGEKYARLISHVIDGGNER